MLNQFELIRIFCAAAEHVSFKDAAIQLGKSPQAVTRAIKELEDLRGEILFYRSTRNIKITSAGEALIGEARATLMSIDKLISPVKTESNEKIEGLISLTLPTALGRRLVMPALSPFQKKYPGIRITCLMTDTHSDMIDKQIDIGLRTGFIRDNRFVARKARDVDFYTVASPEFISKFGVLRDIHSLSKVPQVALLDHSTGKYWPWSYENYGSFVPNNPIFITDDLDAYCDAIISGVGCGQIADYLAFPLIESGLLVPILEDMASSQWGLYVYRPQLGPVPSRIRALFDFLFEYYSEQKFTR